MIRPCALKPGDRVAVVAPASPFDREQFDSGIAELKALGFLPVYDDRVFARRGYVAGDAQLRAWAFSDAWCTPGIAALIAVRGGYGSVQMLPYLDPRALRETPKLFIGYSDTTSLLTFITQACGIVSVHGPMLEGRLARGSAGYDRDSFLACVSRAEPMGELNPSGVEAIRPGEAAGTLVGGTLAQLVASLGTPYAFDPPDGAVLFLDEVGERPYRIDRMFTQLRLSGVLARVSAIIWGELPRCDEAAGEPSARSILPELVRAFGGPVLAGFPSGHTAGPTFTIPFGVRARVISGGAPRLIIEEPAVTA
jgi:muramoyltetrapeptide carboxypeptidase